jgi:hypothetical protein
MEEGRSRAPPPGDQPLPRAGTVAGQEAVSTAMLSNTRSLPDVRPTIENDRVRSLSSKALQRGAVPTSGGSWGGLRSGPTLLRKSISSYHPNQPVIIEFCQRERC